LKRGVVVLCPAACCHYHLGSCSCLLFSCSWFCLEVCVHAHPPSKTKEQEKSKHAVFTLYLFCRCTCLKSVPRYFICIFFTSTPIHELRLDLNVTNTVIALTIRVIYLSLIITLKRGVVVLWLPVVGHYHLSVLSKLLVVVWFLLALVRARAPSKQEPKTTPNNLNEVHVPLSSEVYSDILYPYTLS